MMMGVFFSLCVDSMHQGGKSMHIYISLHKHYNGETDEDNLKYFKLILDKLEPLGFDLKWSRNHLETGKYNLASITTEFPRNPGKDLNDTNKGVTVYDTVFVGYMFCASFPKYHPLSLKRVYENLDEIVLKDNRTMLYQLYEIEFKERYAKK
jgi:hypothetical protein